MPPLHPSPSRYSIEGQRAVDIITALLALNPAAAAARRRAPPDGSHGAFHPYTISPCLSPISPSYHNLPILPQPPHIIIITPHCLPHPRRHRPLPSQSPHTVEISPSYLHLPTLPPTPQTAPPPAPSPTAPPPWRPRWAPTAPLDRPWPRWWPRRWHGWHNRCRRGPGRGPWGPHRYVGRGWTGTATSLLRRRRLLTVTPPPRPGAELAAVTRLSTPAARFWAQKTTTDGPPPRLWGRERRRGRGRARTQATAPTSGSYSRTGRRRRRLSGGWARLGNLSLACLENLWIGCLP